MSHRVKNEYFGFFDHIVSVIKNSIIPLDRIHQIVLEEGIGDLEEVPEQIGA